MSAFFPLAADRAFRTANIVAGSADYTVVGWFKSSAFVTFPLYQTPFTTVNGVATYTEYANVHVTSANITLFLDNSSSTTNIQTPNVFEADTWIPFAYTRGSTGTRQRFYVNRFLVGEVTLDLSGTSLSEVTYGNDTASEGGLTVSRAWEFSAEKTLDELWDLWAATSPSGASLYAQYQFATNINDSSGNARNLTSAGSITFVLNEPPSGSLRQLKPKRLYSAGWGVAVANSTYVAVMDGIGSFAVRAKSFGNQNADTARTPIAAAGTFKNMIVTCNNSGVVTHNDFQLILLKNGSDTALAVSIAAGVFAGSNLSDTVDVAVGDDVSWKLVTVPTLPVGFDIAVSLEFDGNPQIYGMSGRGNSAPVGTLAYAGAFDNGDWQGSVIPSSSSTYSLCAVEGTVARLLIKNLAATPVPGGGWTAWMVVDGVKQDGSGATVDTTTTLADGATGDFDYVDFALPLVLTNKVDILIERTGQAVTPSQDCGPSIGLVYAPNEDGHYMLCGGSNNAISTSVPSWHWVRSDQNTATVEVQSTAIIGTPGMLAHGLYVERSADSTVGSGYTYSLIKDGAVSDISFAFTGTTREGHELADVAFPPDSTASIQLVPIGVPSSSQLHWGLDVSASAANPIPTTETYPIRRVRRIPLPNDELFNLFVSEVQLYAQVGVGLSSGQGSDPVVMFRFSIDAGATWSHERQMSVGKIGQYLRRCRTLRLGRGRDWVLEFVQTDPVFTAWMDVFVKMSRGTS